MHSQQLFLTKKVKTGPAIADGESLNTVMVYFPQQDT